MNKQTGKETRQKFYGRYPGMKLYPCEICVKISSGSSRDEAYWRKCHYCRKIPQSI